MASFEEIVAALEAELDREEADELAAEVADRVRGDQARTTLVQRLRPLVGAPVGVGLAGGTTVRGTLLGLGPDWLLVREDAGPGTVVREAVVPLASVQWLDGLTRTTAGPDGPVAARTRLASVLRRLVLDRAPVVVVTADGSGLSGVLDRVGADYLELALVGAGEFRRAGAVSGVRAVPLAAVVLVRRA